MITKDEACTLAEKMGINAAAWWWQYADRGRDGGNELCLKVAQMIDDGDPVIYDTCPAWLSGEYAGESMTELLDITEEDDADDVSELADLFEMTASDAYFDELRRLASFHMDLD